jgi:hypothetical protein
MAGGTTGGDPGRPLALTDAVAELWGQRPALVDDGGSDADVALGLWWALLEHCVSVTGAEVVGCDEEIDAVFERAGIPLADVTRWDGGDPDARDTGYRLAARLLGRDEQDGAPQQLPGWATEPRSPS